MNVRSLLTAFLVVSLATSIVAVPASAKNGRNAALVGGLIAGALVGAAVADTNRNADRPRYYYGAQPAYGYYPPTPPPPYYYPRPAYCGYPPYPPCY